MGNFKKFITEGLSRKDFEELAAIIKNNDDVKKLKNSLVDWAEKSNPNFDKERFMKAAGL